MTKTFTYKLRPNKKQTASLAGCLELCRLLYNCALAERKEAWELEQRSISFYSQSAELPQAKELCPQLESVHSQVLQDVLHRVDKSYKNFFRRVKAGEEPGYPRFKGECWYSSFTFPQYGNGVKFWDNRLVISKIGHVKFFKDRPLEGKPKTCTIVRKADGWYAHISCEVGPQPIPKTGKSVGVDLGIESFATLSTGEQIPNPRFQKKAEDKLKAADRNLSRKQKGSNGRKKAKNLLAKAHQKVARCRTDFHHKVALDLVTNYDYITVENLNVAGMAKNHPLAKAIHDVGWGGFLLILSAKAERAAKVVEKVNPAYTSQDCSGCGKRVPKKLSERTHSCPYCGLRLHRDHNAALNILNKGGGAALLEAGMDRPVKAEPHGL